MFSGIIKEQWENCFYYNPDSPESIIRKENEISSPTFTIVNTYEHLEKPLYHFDVYRIGDVSEMDEIGYEDYFYGDGLCIIEWANLIEEILPDSYTRIEISKDLSKGFDYRRIEICNISR